MNRFLLKIFAVIVLLICISLGCSDINTVSPSDSISIIKSVVPAQAPYGADVKISGSGFGDGLEDQKVYFNNTLASIKTLNDTSIQTRVPLEATNGPVLVVVQGDTLTGPTFSVDSTKSLFLAIESINPTSGRTGEKVQIFGSGFSTNPDENEVYFNETIARLLSASDTLLTATVPSKAQDGPVLVVANQDTAIGPEFTIIRPVISGISPRSGPVGTDVTITGSGFSAKASENTVTFGGAKASLKKASKTELVATVPKGAETGPVIVTVADMSAEGPEFAIETLQEPKTLTVAIETTGEQIDKDGYTLSVSGKEDRTVKPSDKQLYEDILSEELQVELSGIAENCSLNGENPRKIAMDSDKMTTFSISCINPNEPPIASFTTECTNLGCHFDASGSSDSDGSIANYSWEFGDGQTNTGQTVDYTYDDPGTYTVQLTVTDNDEATDSITHDVTLTVPQITGISPTSGPVSTDVTISGNGFSSTISENVVTFNDVEGTIETATETEIHAIVPEMATTGPVEVTVNGYTVSGPTFTIQQPKSLQVSVQTEGTNQDDSYTLSVSGQDDAVIKPNDDILYDPVYENSVQITLNNVAENCRVKGGENPRNISLSTGSTTSTTFTVDCTVDLRGNIVFTSDRDTFGELYKLVEKTGNWIPSRITETTDYHEVNPAISPDGLQIAFSNTLGGGKHIIVMDSDGSDATQITDSGWNDAPSWSPDGSKIVYARSSNSDAPSDIFIMNSDGSDLQNITNTGTARETNPDWSADGSLIVYESYISPDTDIFTIEPDGTNQTQITDNEVYEFEPEWSPSGERIAFVRDLDETGRNIHIMNSDGSGAEKMTSFTGTERSPTWSPDGTRVAYSRYLDGSNNIAIFSFTLEDISNSFYTPSEDRSPHWNH